MSYDPSHRKPPRQERWPQATPPSGWPSYRDDDAYRDGEHADSRYAADRQGAYPVTAGHRRQAGYQDASGGSADRGYQSAVATDPFSPAMNGYGSAAGFGPVGGYGDAGDGYDWTADGNGANGGHGGNGYGTATAMAAPGTARVQAATPATATPGVSTATPGPLTTSAEPRTVMAALGAATPEPSADTRAP